MDRCGKSISKWIGVEILEAFQKIQLDVVAGNSEPLGKKAEHMGSQHMPWF